MWDVPPLGQMTTSELDGCLEHAIWLLGRRHLMPKDLVVKLDTWRVDLVAEQERPRSPRAGVASAPACLTG
jgi:hypothetical protein